MEMHEPKVGEAHDGEEDVLEGAEPRLYAPDRGECSSTFTGEIAVCWLPGSAAVENSNDAQHLLSWAGSSAQYGRGMVKSTASPARAQQIKHFSTLANFGCIFISF